MNKKYQKNLKIKLIIIQKDLLQKKLFQKLTGFGISKNLHFKDIEIKNNKKGKPSINIKKIFNYIFKKKI